MFDRVYLAVGLMVVPSMLRGQSMLEDMVTSLDSLNCSIYSNPKMDKRLREKYAPGFCAKLASTSRATPDMVRNAIEADLILLANLQLKFFQANGKFSKTLESLDAYDGPPRHQSEAMRLMAKHDMGELNYDIDFQQGDFEGKKRAVVRMYMWFNGYVVCRVNVIAPKWVVAPYCVPSAQPKDRK